MTVTAVISLISCLLGLVLTASRLNGLRGTTLVQPASWLMLFFGVSALCQISSSATLHFLASSLSFCPLISLLGARRPHQSGFNLVVITLWIVITSPAWESILLGRGGELRVGGVKMLLLVSLIAGTPGTYMFTRHTAAGIVAGVGQALIFGIYLWGPEAAQWTWLGFPCIAIALSLATYLTGSESNQTTGLTRAWLEYRDRFGTLWGLRLLERLRGISRTRNWDLKLKWCELSNESEWTEEQHKTIAQEMRNVMRRFMAQPWIEQRLIDRPVSRIEAGQ